MTLEHPLIRRGCPEILRSEGVVGVLKPAVFFDRDGVLNVDRGYVYRREEFEWVEGAREVVRRVREEGKLAIVVTNQSGIGRGYYTEQDFLTLMSWFLEELVVDGVYYCPHAPEVGCPARKPGTRMIEHAARDLGVDLERSVLIGDKVSDMEAAESSGMTGLRFQGEDLYRFALENRVISEETS